MYTCTVHGKQPRTINFSEKANRQRKQAQEARTGASGASERRCLGRRAARRRSGRARSGARCPCPESRRSRPAQPSPCPAPCTRPAHTSATGHASCDEGQMSG